MHVTALRQSDPKGQREDAIHLEFFREPAVTPRTSPRSQSSVPGDRSTTVATEEGDR